MTAVQHSILDVFFKIFWHQVFFQVADTAGGKRFSGAKS
jgi:hypothetical protein